MARIVVSAYIEKPKKKRPGVHAKTKTSKRAQIQIPPGPGYPLWFASWYILVL